MTPTPNWPGYTNPKGFRCAVCFDWTQQLAQCPRCKRVWCDHCGGTTVEEGGEKTSSGDWLQRGCLTHWKELETMNDTNT